MQRFRWWQSLQNIIKNSISFSFERQNCWTRSDEWNYVDLNEFSFSCLPCGKSVLVVMRRYEFDSIWTTTRRENQNSFGLYKKRKTISHSLCEWCGYWYWYWLSAAQKVSNLSSEMAKRAHVQTDRFIYLVKSLRDRVCSAMGNESAKHAGRQAGR